MAKILATEIRAGNLLEWDKRLWRVLKSHHVHVGGRGGAYMQVEMKDIESGQKRNERIATDEKLERPYIDRRTMVFSYQDGDVARQSIARECLRCSHRLPLMFRGRLVRILQELDTRRCLLLHSWPYS